MWFSAKIVFKSVHKEKPKKSALFEESLIIFKSRSEQSAKLKVEKMAKKKEHAYKNAYGETVSWEFQRIVDIQEILDRDLKDGTEVFSKFFKQRSPGSRKR